MPAEPSRSYDQLYVPSDPPEPIYFLPTFKREDESCHHLNGHQQLVKQPWKFELSAKQL